MLLGEAVRDLVAGDVGADQRVERAGAVAEVHRRAVPERVLVAGLVMHAHHQLEAERVHAGVGRVHVGDYAAELEGVVDRRIAAVDGLVGVARAGVGVGRGAAGAAVEVHRLHVGVVHRAGGAGLGDVHVAEDAARTPLVLAGLGVAARAGADQRRGQAFPLLQHLAGVRIDDHERTRRFAAHARRRRS